MNKAVGTVISANTMRMGMGLDPAPARKHKLGILPGPIWASEITLKCVKCTRGILILDRAAVRLFVAGKLPLMFSGVAWGSWGICREDAPPTTPDWRNR
jgi:hypothetical protein